MGNRIELLILLIAAWMLPSVAAAQQPADGAAGELFQEAIDKAHRRTVKIYGASVGRQKGYATGVIVSADGKVLTAQGVFLSGSSIRVVLPSGKVHLATVLRAIPQ